MAGSEASCLDLKEAAMGAISLYGICTKISGAKCSLGREVQDLIRINNPERTVPLEGVSKAEEDRVDGWIARKFEGHAVNRKVRRSVDYRKALSLPRGNFEDRAVRLWEEARTHFAESRLPEARLAGRQLNQHLSGVRTVFAQHFRNHADAVTLHSQEGSSHLELEQRLRQTQRLQERYWDEKDLLSTIIELLSEAQLERTLSILDESTQTKRLKKALKITNNALDLLNAKCHRGFDEYAVALVRHVGSFQGVRLMEEADELKFQKESYEETIKASLRCLSESALRIRGGLGLLECLRAEASMHLYKGHHDLSIQKTAEACFVYDHAPIRSPMSAYSLMGRLLHWYSRAHPKGAVSDIRRQIQQAAIGDAGSYESQVRTTFLATCHDVDRWILGSAPACYVSRMSTFYIDPKLDRI
jgi:hypothetical protein